MSQLSRIRLLIMLSVVLALCPLRMLGQDDPSDTPLGDVARSLRKKTPPAAQQVIDDDNLPQVMQQVESHRGAGSALRFLMTGDSKEFQVSAPDVTCSLSFSASVKTLLSGQYAQMDLPPDDLAKLEGEATIEGDALTVPIFNKTEWHLSELAVAFTIVKKAGSSEPTAPADAFQQVRPEKKRDVTVIYRMRTAGPPWVKTVFSAPMNLDLAPDEDWHWSIVQARGYPPGDYVGGVPPNPVQTSGASVPLIIPSSLLSAPGNDPQ